MKGYLLLNIYYCLLLVKRRDKLLISQNVILNLLLSLLLDK